MNTVSPFTGKPYTVTLVCEALGLARSTFYVKSQGAGKRGPKTPQTDEELLGEIRRDLAESPFVGEGHRKPWARLRFVNHLRVGRTRVLRLMRENNLLAPARRTHIHGNKAHDGTITTEAPNVMWGTDGTRFFTREDGWCWLFVAPDHFNTECLGWTVVKTGDRFAALEPIRQAVKSQFGGFAKGIAEGLKLRMDHGSQYMSGDFLAEIKFLGIEASPAFVGEPECNGVAERLIGIIKEQCIGCHRFNDIAEAQEAIGKFIETYNRAWLIERLGFRSPSTARREYRERAA